MSTDMFLDKVRGCIFGGVIGDALGTPSEGRDYRWIKEELGWIDDFEDDGTDDTILKNLLTEALVKTDGHATLDDWAQAWLDNYGVIIGKKVGKFFQSVLHTANKLHRGVTPRMCALGNMPSSSSAMAISPIGVVNACNPRAAVRQAYDVASLIHIYDVSFCQDGAAAMAAAVAAAFCRDATVDSVLDAAVAFLQPASGAMMRGLIADALAVAADNPTFDKLTQVIYDDGRFFRTIQCDSRETIPLTLALFKVAGGDFEKTVTYGANFGRDADTIGTMGGAIAGALGGIEGVRPAWVEKLTRVSENDYEALSASLAETARKKAELEQEAAAHFHTLITG